MNLKISTLIDGVLFELTEESYNLMKEVMGDYFDFTRTGSISKGKLSNIRQHIRNLNAIMEKIEK